MTPPRPPPRPPVASRHLINDGDAKWLDLEGLAENHVLFGGRPNFRDSDSKASVRDPEGERKRKGGPSLLTCKMAFHALSHRPGRLRLAPSNYLLWFGGFIGLASQNPKRKATLHSPFAFR